MSRRPPRSFDGRHKLIHHRGNPDQSELYDLKADPTEQLNLYAIEPEIVARLREFLVEDDALTIKRVSSKDGGPDTNALDQLGYTGDDSGD